MGHQKEIKFTTPQSDTLMDGAIMDRDSKTSVLDAECAEHSKAPRDTLRHFFQQFISYIKARKLYPPGHQRFTHQTDAMFDAMDKVFLYQKEISIYVQPVGHRQLEIPTHALQLSRQCS